MVTEIADSAANASPPVLSALSDADLLDAWTRDQHAAALAALVERYKVMVLSVCRRRCRSQADAEDAFQTTFLYLARNSKKIRHPERLAGWLHRVAQRAAVATLKPVQREVAAMMEPAIPDDPLDRLTQRHEAIVLDEELADLPEHYRSAIVMHLYEGHPIQTLADHFGTTVGSIRGRLQRGKQLLAQRLRRRGVVPIMAFASASAWTATAPQASHASDLLTEAIRDGDLPDPPIDTPLLESLLAQGVRLMPSLYTVAGLVGGSALIALLMMTDGTQGQTTSQRKELSFPSSAAPLVAQFGGGSSSATDAKDNSGNGGTSASGVGASGGSGGVPGAGAPGNLVWTEKAVLPEPTSALARRVIDAMGNDVDLDIATTLDKLPGLLSEAADVPVQLDDRGVKFAELDVEKESVKFAAQAIPLQSALRRMLHPLGLKAVVEDEGLVITADPSALVHKGIGTSRWTNVDEDAEKLIAAALDKETTVDFLELPLADVISLIAEQHKLQILVDQRALEEIGISVDEPITITLNGVKLRSLLRIMLRNLDLTYAVYGESLMITTKEAAEQSLVNRIYWLEGTGFANGDFQSISSAIQTSIHPDTWEVLGGPSTMAPLTSLRPAILISSTYPIHEQIDQFFQALRETHFGNDPVLESTQVPTRQSRQTVGGSGTGGGGMGGGGGGGFF